MNYLLLGLLLVATWVISFVAEKSVSRGQKLSNLNYSWFVASWLPGLALLSAPIYVFPEDFSFEDVLYMWGLHAFFVFGSFVGRISGNQTRYSLRPFLTTNGVILGFLLIGFFGQALNGFDSFSSGKLSFSARFDTANLADLKSDYKDYDQEKSLLGPLSGLVRYLIGIGQLGLVIYSFASANKIIKKSKIVMGFYFLLIAISCFNSWFITAGRLGITMTVLMALIPRTIKIAVKEKPRKFRIGQKFFSYLFLSAVLGGGVWYLSTAFLVGRLGTTDADIALEAVHRATIDPFSAPTIEKDPVLEALVFQLSYLTNPIPTAAFYIDQKTLPGPHWGAVNFPQLMGPFQLALGTASPNAAKRYDREIEAPLVQAGYFGSVWCTMVREILIDFGYWGTPVFFLVFGLVSGVTQRSLSYRPSVPKAALLALLRIQMLWSGFHSLFYHQLFAYALLMALVVLIVSALVKPKRQFQRVGTAIRL